MCECVSLYILYTLYRTFKRAIPPSSFNHPFIHFPPTPLLLHTWSPHSRIISQLIRNKSSKAHTETQNTEREKREEASTSWKCRWDWRPGFSLARLSLHFSPLLKLTTLTDSLPGMLLTALFIHWVFLSRSGDEILIHLFILWEMMWWRESWICT